MNTATRIAIEGGNENSEKEIVENIRNIKGLDDNDDTEVMELVMSTSAINVMNDPEKRLVTS